LTVADRTERENERVSRASAAREVIVGIDAGTSVIKSVAFDLAGRQIAVAARPNSFAQGPGGGAEQDMARTWAETAETLAELMGRLPGGAGSVLAVAVTGQGDGTWLIDAAGEPVAPAWLWLDARAGPTAAGLAGSERHRRHYRATGTGISPCQQNAQLLCMKRQAPHLIERAATAFHCKDWLYFRLTGVRASDPSEAVFTFGDFRTRRYDDAVIDNLGLEAERRLLPPIVDGVRESHPLAPGAAAATGLPAGTPIVLGYVDFVTTAIGGGLLSSGGDAGCSILGSTGMHERFVASPDEVVLNHEESGYVALLPYERSVAQIQSNMAATLNIDWMLDLARGLMRHEGLDRARHELVRSLDERVLAAAPLGAIYHPYISKAGERGPFMSPLARAQFTGFHSETGFYDMMRAVLEGLAFASRDCYSATGAIPAEIRLTGGAARSRAMRRILASVLARPVRIVEQDEAGAAGAAMIAATQQGVFPDMVSATETWASPRLSEPTAPDVALAGDYAAAFELYRDLRRSLAPAWERLDAIRRRSLAPAGGE
jgi:erythritol kinase (D-erythritol 1-phosphate-forming)